MKITNVTFYPFKGEGNILGTADVVFDEQLVVRGIRLLSGKYGTFIGFPSRKDKDGKYNDIVFTLTKDLRSEIQKAILKESGYTGGKKSHGGSEEDDPFFA